MNAVEHVYVSIFPAPADEYAKILITLRGDYTMEITDQHGKVLCQQQFTGRFAFVNTTHFPSGTYVVRLKSKYWHGEQTMVVNHGGYQAF
ncbi:MAG: T9SS type A sorting domain-containing protein [Flavobacteriales bacterium]|nr:T9SS type A sorting domain-containing protein [Flavobacteriales bacterium]MCB9447972.1 T9SS type A sorting domain-containing protein [Flavobacteriales bacterium]